MASSRLSNLRKELECPICLELFTDPHTNTCDHTFCFECANNSLRIADKCPLCKHPMFKRALRKNYRLANIVELVREDEAAAAAAAATSSGAAATTGGAAGTSDDGPSAAVLAASRPLSPGEAERLFPTPVKPPPLTISTGTGKRSREHTPRSAASPPARRSSPSSPTTPDADGSPGGGGGGGRGRGSRASSPVASTGRGRGGGRGRGRGAACSTSTTAAAAGCAAVSRSVSMPASATHANGDGRGHRGRRGRDVDDVDDCVAHSMQPLTLPPPDDDDGDGDVHHQQQQQQHHEHDDEAAAAAGSSARGRCAGGARGRGGRGRGRGGARAASRAHDTDTCAGAAVDGGNDNSMDSFASAMSVDDGTTAAAAATASLPQPQPPPAAHTADAPTAPSPADVSALVSHYHRMMHELEETSERYKANLRELEAINAKLHRTDSTLVVPIAVSAAERQPPQHRQQQQQQQQPQPMDDVVHTLTAAAAAPRAVRVVSTGLERHEWDRVRRYVHALGGETTDAWDTKVSHVVTKPLESRSARCTFKYMAACLFGAHVVSIDWVTHSHNKARFVEERAYEIDAVTVFSERTEPRIIRRPPRDRLLRCDAAKLFAGLAVLLIGGPRCNEIAALVELAGGHIERLRHVNDALRQRAPKATSGSAAMATPRTRIVVVSEDEDVEAKITREWIARVTDTFEMPPVSTAYLRDCICTLSLCDTADYVIRQSRA